VAPRHAYQLKVDDPWSSHGRILAMLPRKPGGRLLDVGCAQGSLSILLAAQGFEVTCIEREPTAAEEARQPGLRVLEADIMEGVPLEGETFDVIVLGDVLEHVPKPEEVLPRLLRHLTPAGQVIVSVPNVAHLWVRLNLLVGRFEYTDRGILDRTHLRFFTCRSFRRLLHVAGLRVESLAATPVPLHLLVRPRFHGAWLRGVQRARGFLAQAWKSVFGYQFVACCRREEAR
jgi:methionine biosynthesis protein MetW